MAQWSLGKIDVSGYTVWMRTLQETLKAFLERHARHVLSLGLLFGLLWDTLTINRADNFFENITIVGYLTLTALTIVLLAWHARHDETRDHFFPLLVLQFAFGNLASALLVLFIKSGTLAGGFFFLIPFGALLIANEFLHRQYLRTHVHVVVWYFFVLTYAIFAVPVVMRSFGNESVAIGILVALASVAVLLTVLVFISRVRVVQHVPRIVASVGIVTALFVALYTMRAIPPVPLSATHIGVYHSVEKKNDTYDVTFEKSPWYTWWHDTSTTFSYEEGARLYCFTAIYAPQGISTRVFHRFEYKNRDGSWETILRIPFVISGGREHGFRGYSFTAQGRVGEWRCSAETERGTLIARFNFTVIPQTPVLQESVL